MSETQEPTLFRMTIATLVGGNLQSIERNNLKIDEILSASMVIGHHDITKAIEEKYEITEEELEELIEKGFDARPAECKLAWDFFLWAVNDSPNFPFKSTFTGKRKIPQLSWHRNKK